MARVIVYGTAAAGAAAAGVLAYRAHTRGTSFMEEFDEAFHEIFPSPVERIEQQEAPASLAVSAADLEGRSPNIQHPSSSGPATPSSSSLFMRRQASKKGGGGIVLSDDVSIPGSLAVSSALVDGGSPSLKLSNDGEGTLIGRRSARSTPSSTPTASAGKNKSLLAPSSPASPAPMTASAVSPAEAPPTQEILSMAVSVDAAEGKETKISMDPTASLLHRRSSMKVGTPGKKSEQTGLEDATSLQGGNIMTATVSEMEGDVSSPSLVLGADSDFKASIFNRRKSQKSECTLANTTTLSALEGAPAQVSVQPPSEKSGLLQRRQSQRGAAAPADTAESMEPQTMVSFAVSGAALEDKDTPLKLEATEATGGATANMTLLQRRASVKKPASDAANAANATTTGNGSEEAPARVSSSDASGTATGATAPSKKKKNKKGK
eukprot:Tamp_07892.p1 GENE.Tamp_07892~~Tamp_07892.p1  ORF type:complete len:452 (+),score=83.69 Tamp_07892:51-1358(+)